MAPSYFQRNSLLFCFVAAAEAYKVFETTCSTPPPTTQVNFVSSPDARGTLDILWSSLFTIVACTWTVQHLNIPEQRNGRDPGWVGDLKWKFKKFLTSAKWMLITMIAPEVAIGLAANDLSQAKQSLKRLRKFALNDNVPWTLSHSFYANMGGFVIESGIHEAPHATPYITAETVTANNHPDRTVVTPVEGEERKVMKSKEKPLIAKISENGENIHNYDPYHVTAMQIYDLREKGVLSRLPYVREEELEDKSKSDSFVKTIAVIQIIWAATQIIVRAARKLAISQLELAVIAFAACAFITYLFYWSKPKSVSTTITILQYQDQLPEDVLKFSREPTERLGLVFLHGNAKTSRRGSRIKNDAIDGNAIERDFAILAMIFGAALFSGIHIGAWNFNFPSAVELIFWRCASVYSTAYGPILLFIGIAFNNVKLDKIVVPFLTLLYIIARLYLLVEIFRTLCFLPYDAYITTWATNIPHIG